MTFLIKIVLIIPFHGIKQKKLLANKIYMKYITRCGRAVILRSGARERNAKKDQSGD
ncbi:hypothetical protein GTPT_2204 [Tatumella ptyseos ATCC 33301]|uniref:Uncharacterized protein n=1 Tax=Tatumella ptyseos ATCC 33301 TaxID=1005995 RepID=A0A085JEK7_9GAMM|nr:hypothetical protein GTPT_2204 [Tatumella ptyseos ATCC 33301]